MTDTAQVVSKRLYQRTGALFVCALFVGVYVAHDIASFPLLDTVYVAFQEIQGVVLLTVQTFAALVLYMGAARHIAQYRTQPRTMVVRAATIIVFSIILAAFYFSQYPGMETTVQSGAVNTVLQGSCTWGLFLARYGMMYYWVLRRFCEFRTIDRIVQLIIWFILVFRDTPILVQLVPGIDTVADWILTTIYRGTLSGVLFTVAIGAVVLTMRALLGREPGLIEAEIS